MDSAAIWFVSLLLVSGNVTASNPGEVSSGLVRAQLQAAVSACDVSLGKLTQVNWKNETTTSYKADNDLMHLCLFMFELAASNCVEIKACTKYEEWSVKNSDINPNMPRETFWRKYEERRNRLKLFTVTK